MSLQEEGAFFATQVNMQQNEAPLDKQNLKKDSSKHKLQPKQQEHREQQLAKIQVNDQSPSHDQDQVQLKKLLELFNSYDKSQRGTIDLNQCQQIIWTFSHISKPSKQQIEVYYKLSQPTNLDLVTFDEFLFIFGLCEFAIQTKSIDDQYDYCKRTDPKVIDFLRLLNNYRKKCEKQSIYQEAKKSKQKIQLVRQNQYERRKHFLNLIHKRQLQGLEEKQKQKFIEFCQTWDDFMNEYEQTASELVKRLGQKQDQQMKEFIEKTREQLASKIRFSKKIVELQDLEKKLVKTQEYQKADKVKAQIEQLKIFQLQKKQKEDLSVVELRAQTLRKQHSAAINTLLQKIQKDRNDQSKQRISDSQKLIVKSKTLVTEVKHRHTESLKKLYEALHNVTIDDARIIASIQTGTRAKSTYGQPIRQRS